METENPKSELIEDENQEELNKEDIPEIFDIDEKDVGILLYLSSGESVQGTLKYRFSDFIVNEINSNGEVITLTPTDFESDLNFLKSTEASDPLKKNESYTITEEKQLKLKKIFSHEIIVGLGVFMNEAKNSTEKLSKLKHEIFLDCPEGKEDRKEIHQIVRECLPLFESVTLEQTNPKKIKIFFRGNAKSYREQLYDKKKKYLNFVLQKTNLDSMNAIYILSKTLHKKPSDFAIAGTKDKRGITCQQVSAFNLSLKAAINACSESKWNTQMKIGKYYFSSECLRLGQHKGNRFRILLRFVDNIQLALSNAENLKKNGFINYFGMQRFGNTPSSTNIVGKTLLKKDWKTAFSLIINPEYGKPEAKKVKSKFLENYDCMEALKHSKLLAKNEIALIQGLQKYGLHSYLNAIMSLTRNMRELYVHSYQSYLWNKAVSRRLAMGTSQPLPGDIVLENDTDLEYPDFENKESNCAKMPGNNTKFKVLKSVEGISIYDIVMPLFGCDIKLPEDCLAYKIYKDLLDEETITLEDFEFGAKNFFCTGSWRKIICRPENLKYASIYFTSKDEDILNGHEDFESIALRYLTPGQYSGVALEFNLTKSSYATMLLREVTRSSTSYSNLVKNNLNINQYAEIFVQIVGILILEASNLSF